eukprot:CAMPEP_0196791618 /NCGR_PEP_ID=MMETSP1104-20130614/30135_1 /TAXON_ID=33652 /ORGANISM="Cafeteria sp., Strain Caron Lab Isolate" /LENGTH=49 /DNA_ID= /DNA_START= /DNA_END= /DNA_ORIENTATION=
MPAAAVYRSESMRRNRPSGMADSTNAIMKKAGECSEPEVSASNGSRFVS